MQGMATSDVLTIVGIVVGLAVQAVGLVLYWNKVIGEIRASFEKQLSDQRSAHDADMEKLHGRINNIRKEFVLGDQYQRDLAELKQGHREIMGAIERTAEIMRERIREGEAVDIRHDMRIASLEKRTGGGLGAAQ